jgi:hypothetical protein
MESIQDMEYELNSLIRHYQYKMKGEIDFFNYTKMEVKIEAFRFCIDMIRRLE